MPDSLTTLRAALADDLDALARLHDRELDAPTVAALRETGFPDSLALIPVGKAGAAAIAEMRIAVAGLTGDARSLELLAADYAGIFLNGACAASPYESVWLHDEHLACQQPMFELRELYAQAGLRVDDWRKRYDDHLALQFQFLAHRLRNDSGADTLAALGRVLEAHVGFWYPDFAARVAARCDSAFYRALVILTSAWLARLAEVIAEICGVPATPREELAARIRAKFAQEAAGVAPLKFMPGAAGPSW